MKIGECKPLEAWLARIAACEPSVRAWVEVNPQPALSDGPLSGLPFGAKDIFETAGMATEYGSPIYAGRKGERDAAVVEHLRRRGAILLGKTQTTAFASFDPAPTGNPRLPGHTPGGSSSRWPPPWPPGWWRSRWGRRRSARLCGRPPTAACAASSRHSAGFPWRASCRSLPRSIPWDCLRPRPPTWPGCGRAHSEALRRPRADGSRDSASRARRP